MTYSYIITVIYSTSIYLKNMNYMLVDLETHMVVAPWAPHNPIFHGLPGLCLLSRGKIPGSKVKCHENLWIYLMYYILMFCRCTVDVLYMHKTANQIHEANTTLHCTNIYIIVQTMECHTVKSDRSLTATSGKTNVFLQPGYLLTDLKIVTAMVKHSWMLSDLGSSF